MSYSQNQDNTEIKTIIRALAAHYGSEKLTDQQLDRYVRCLREYDPNVIRQACRRCVEERDKMPQPQLIQEAAVVILTERMDSFAKVGPSTVGGFWVVVASRKILGNKEETLKFRKEWDAASERQRAEWVTEARDENKRRTLERKGLKATERTV